MNYEIIETSADGTAKLLKATKDECEYTYVEIIGDGKGPVQLGCSSKETYGVGRFPEDHIKNLRKGFKDCGYPISEKCIEKYIKGIKKINDSQA